MDGELGILEGRTAALLHPAGMGAPPLPLPHPPLLFPAALPVHEPPPRGFDPRFSRALPCCQVDRGGGSDLAVGGPPGVRSTRLLPPLPHPGMIHPTPIYFLPRPLLTMPLSTISCEGHIRVSLLLLFFSSSSSLPLSPEPFPRPALIFPLLSPPLPPGALLVMTLYAGYLGYQWKQVGGRAGGGGGRAGGRL